MDPDVSKGPASEWCSLIRVMEIVIEVFKYVWQPEPKVTVMVDEEYW